MTTSIYPYPLARHNPLAESVLRKVGAGNFIVESGRKITGTKPNLSTEPLNSYEILNTSYIETVETSPETVKVFNIELDSGEAFIGGRWIAIDTSSTHTIRAKDNQKLYLSINITNEELQVFSGSEDETDDVVVYGHVQLGQNNTINIIPDESRYIPRASNKTTIENHTHGLNDGDALLSVNEDNTVDTSYIVSAQNSVFKVQTIEETVDANSKTDIELNVSDTATVFADLGDIQTNQTNAENISADVIGYPSIKVRLRNESETNKVITATVIILD